MKHFYKFGYRVACGLSIWGKDSKSTIPFTTSTGDMKCENCKRTQQFKEVVMDLKRA